MSDSKYQEAKSNIVNTLVRQIGYEAYKNLYSEDFDTLQELVDKAVSEFIVSQRKNGIKKKFFYNYPNCGVPLPYNFDYDYQIKNKCCLECRQVLDWSDIDDR